MRHCAVFAEVLSVSVSSLLKHRRVTSGLVAIVFAGLAATVTTSGDAGPHVHDMTLSGARLSDSAGRLVITLNARGDLRGLVTLTLSVGPDGAITGGDWALVVSHIEDLNPDGSVAPSLEEEHEHSDAPSDVPLEEDHDESVPHQESIRFVNKGTLGGGVIGGFVGTGSDGALALVNVQLQLTSTSLTFASKTSGDGSLDADLGRNSAQGSLRLNF